MDAVDPAYLIDISGAPLPATSQIPDLLDTVRLSDFSKYEQDLEYQLFGEPGEKVNKSAMKSQRRAVEKDLIKPEKDIKKMGQTSGVSSIFKQDSDSKSARKGAKKSARGTARNRNNGTTTDRNSEVPDT